MAHTIKEKEKLILRVRRIRGQVEAVERWLRNKTAPMFCDSLLLRVAR